MKPSTISKIQLVLDIILFSSITLMLLISPYTKVEESFNVQALHDFINIGADRIELFDHTTFQGAVKRTCIGALFLSFPSIFIHNTMENWAKSLISFAILIHTYLPTSINAFLSVESMEKIFLLTKLPQLLITRFLLSILTFFSILKLRKSIKKACNKNSNMVGIWFSLLFYPLPHILYYSSRFLPNFICFPLTNFAVSLFIKGDINRAISVFVFTGMIYRFEVLIFTGILTFLCLIGFLRHGAPLISLRETVVSVLAAVLLGGFLSSKVDSYFWDVDFTIPEFESFLFNIVGGNSSDWGVESVYAYFVKYLPKLFISGFDLVLVLSAIFLVLSVLSYIYKRKLIYEVDHVNYSVGTTTLLMWASIFYICVLSLNGHKEWRFLTYTIPILCIGAANSFEWIITRFPKLRTVCKMMIIVSYLASIIFSFLFAIISSWNYSGGDSVQKLNLRLIEMYESNKVMLKPVIIHWDVGTCMNGGSLFTQLADNKILRSGWIEDDQPDMEPKYWVIYDKTEDFEELQALVDDFDYWIQYDDEPVIALNPDSGYEWILIDVIDGYAGLDLTTAVNILQNPKDLFMQCLHSLETGNLNWFRNLLDKIIKKKIRGRIWEKYPIENTI